MKSRTARATSCNRELTWKSATRLSLATALTLLVQSALPCGLLPPVYAAPSKSKSMLAQASKTDTTDKKSDKQSKAKEKVSKVATADEDKVKAKEDKIKDKEEKARAKEEAKAEKAKAKADAKEEKAKAKEAKEEKVKGKVEDKEDKAKAKDQVQESKGRGIEKDKEAEEDSNKTSKKKKHGWFGHGEDAAQQKEVAEEEKSKGSGQAEVKVEPKEGGARASTEKQKDAPASEKTALEKPVFVPDSALISVLQDMTKALNEVNETNGVQSSDEKTIVGLSRQILEKALASKDLKENRILAAEFASTAKNSMVTEAWSSGDIQVSNKLRGSIAAVWGKRINGMLSLTIAGDCQDKSLENGEKVGEFVVVIQGRSPVKSGFDIQSQSDVTYWIGTVGGITVDAACCRSKDEASEGADKEGTEPATKEKSEAGKEDAVKKKSQVVLEPILTSRGRDYLAALQKFEEQQQTLLAVKDNEQAGDGTESGGNAGEKTKHKRGAEGDEARDIRRGRGTDEDYDERLEAREARRSRSRDEEGDERREARRSRSTDDDADDRREARRSRSADDDADDRREARRSRSADDDLDDRREARRSRSADDDLDDRREARRARTAEDDADDRREARRPRTADDADERRARPERTADEDTNQTRVARKPRAAEEETVERRDARRERTADGDVGEQRETRRARNTEGSVDDRRDVRRTRTDENIDDRREARHPRTNDADDQLSDNRRRHASTGNGEIAQRGQSSPDVASRWDEPTKTSSSGTTSLPRISAIPGPASASSSRDWESPALATIVRQPSLGASLLLPERAIAGKFLTVGVMNKDRQPERSVELSFNGATLCTDQQGQIPYMIPDDATPGRTLHISLAARPELSPGVVEILQPLFSSEEQKAPQIDRVSKLVTADGMLTVDGHDFDGFAARNHILVDGQHEASVIAASPVQLKVFLPRNIAPGAHTVNISGTTMRTNPMTFDFIKTAIELPDLKKAKGALNRLVVRVEGTRTPVPIRIVNRTPEVIKLSKGDNLLVTTSGGADNSIVLGVKQLRKGDYKVDANVEL